MEINVFFFIEKRYNWIKWQLFLICRLVSFLSNMQHLHLHLELSRDCRISFEMCNLFPMNCSSRAKKKIEMLNSRYKDTFRTTLLVLIYWFYHKNSSIQLNRFNWCYRNSVEYKILDTFLSESVRCCWEINKIKINRIFIDVYCKLFYLINYVLHPMTVVNIFHHLPTSIFI